jgi:hypothetical protein
MAAVGERVLARGTIYDSSPSDIEEPINFNSRVGNTHGAFGSIGFGGFVDKNDILTRGEARESLEEILIRLHDSPKADVAEAVLALFFGAEDV